MFNRLLSFFFPITLVKTRGQHGQSLDIRLENGRKVLNSSNANYSFGSLHGIWKVALKKVKIKDNEKVLVLGGGTGSIPEIIHVERMVDAEITLVEYDAVVIRLGQDHFDLKASDRLHIVHADAFDHCVKCSDLYDLILIDIFDDLNVPKELCAPEFWHDLTRMVGKHGAVILNTIEHETSNMSLLSELSATLHGTVFDVERKQIGDLNHLYYLSKSGSSL